MKITKFVCDWCEDEVDQNKIVPLKSKTNREMDPSGNGYIQNYKYVDVCHRCIQEFVDQLQKEL